MKLPDILYGLLPKKEETKEYFFSLYLDRDAAAVSVWSLNEQKIPVVSSFAHAVIVEDSWEARIHVIDRLLSAAEDKVGVTKAITKTVFGVPGVYLTSQGDITDVVRPQLKKLSQMLELTPVGFVPLSQAIAFQLKNNEGVPPSVILIGCSKSSAHVTLFRVGNETHDDTIDLGEDPVAAFESVLKKHQDGDVLPSRILLFGGNSSVLEEVRSKLLKHPWPTRTNFLHFPKIEIIDLETLLTAVSLAGASELAKEVEVTPEIGSVSTVVAQANSGSAELNSINQEQENDDVVERMRDFEGEEGIHEVKEEEETEEEKEESEEIVVDEKASTIQSDNEDVANVQVVTPESLGFRHEDILEEGSSLTQKRPTFLSRVKKPSFTLPKIFTIPKLPLSGFKIITPFVIRMPKMRAGIAPFIIGGIVCILLGVGFFFAVPRVTVTVLVASLSVDESASLTVDPKAVVSDEKANIIPGKTKEQSVTGEKTIAVSGKKNIGDPARGVVTIYNKITNSRTFPKGTQLTTGNVVFTLDSDVSVASASESIGSITFGKTTANVTAKDIGPNGNVASSSEFTFANISSNQVSARNESAFTGGTSRQVTVVSRADQDALVKALTDELIVKAKQQLLSVGESGERFIDQTIKTQVSEKVFSQELDEETKELHGKVTIGVSGIAIADSDVKAVLLNLVGSKVPSGYVQAPEQTNVTISNVSVKKDGTITLSAKLTTIALPHIDADALKAKLAGKKITNATEILRQTTGVAGAEYRFVFSPSKTRLPLSKNNITITVMVQ